jgi:streptomycin 6-kinase
VVLKVSPRRGDPYATATHALGAEALALRAWSQAGAAVPVLATADGGATLLLERVIPGLALGEVISDPLERTRVIGKLAGALHLMTPVAGLPRLRELVLVQRWQEALQDHSLALQMLDGLLRSGEERMLHLDLHSHNVLQHGERWVAIDPTPCLGDPHADIHGLLHCAPLDGKLVDLAQARQLAEHWAEAAHLDPLRACQWLGVIMLAGALREPTSNPERLGCAESLIAPEH